MDSPLERKVFWVIGIVVAGIFLYPTDLNPFTQKNPSWQVIKEAVAGTVYCADSESIGDGEGAIGYAPCVRLTNVTFDTELGDKYCYSADVEIGGYDGETYEDIYAWNLYGNEYYCVSWYAKYVDEDMNNPDDWRITFEGDSPASLV
jgi:hypothetical protein